MHSSTNEALLVVKRWSMPKVRKRAKVKTVLSVIHVTKRARALWASRRTCEVITSGGVNHVRGVNLIREVNWCLQPHRESCVPTCTCFFWSKSTSLEDCVCVQENVH